MGKQPLSLTFCHVFDIKSENRMKSNLIKLSILGISFSQVQAGAYALIFAEENGIRRLPIVIGTPEAQSIAIVMEASLRPAPCLTTLSALFLKS